MTGSKKKPIEFSMFPKGSDLIFFKQSPQKKNGIYIGTVYKHWT